MRFIGTTLKSKSTSAFEYSSVLVLVLTLSCAGGTESGRASGSWSGYSTAPQASSNGEDDESDVPDSGEGGADPEGTSRGEQAGESNEEEADQGGDADEAGDEVDSDDSDDSSMADEEGSKDSDGAEDSGPGTDSGVDSGDAEDSAAPEGDSGEEPEPEPEPEPIESCEANCYGDPPPCQDKENSVTITGIPGDVCAPVCRQHSDCPPLTDGTARPACILQLEGSDTPTNCALACTPGKAGECPGDATCKENSPGNGICTYGGDESGGESGSESGTSG